ncbi:MAG: peptide deformylase [bacterium]|jgi:peptide deformylase
MAADKIRLYGDPVLRKVSEPVAEIDDEIRELFQRLIDTVEEAGGLGLAAPQIGVLKRVIVVVDIDEDGRRSHLLLVNPEIVSACGEEAGEEGCLSVPEVYARVKRAQSLVLKGIDREGREVEIEASGIGARAFAHEIDHLDGVLFVDRIGRVKRGLIRKRLNEIKKQSKEILRSLQ